MRLRSTVLIFTRDLHRGVGLAHLCTSSAAVEQEHAEFPREEAAAMVGSRVQHISMDRPIRVVKWPASVDRDAIVEDNCIRVDVGRWQYCRK
jgi:hypothetical protein